ncbi:unnamed protein product [Adineta steineri]|uniref:Uncharacterized protein n=1 Tax=Adineta steineri TaxID=433720 RepID=A0A819L332_9BILA|nr:unnamed protein product [Adineta steineri]CAF3959257.1 unnamed protein product [Adineta steineri]
MNRYLICVNQVCTCPPNTYWDELLCKNQKYAGESCSQQGECRSDSFDLVCTPETCPTTGMSNVCSTGINMIAINLTMNYGFSYSLYQYNFTAIYSSALITISIQRLSWYWDFDDFSLINSNESELLLNGGFETGDTAYWIYCNPHNSGYAGYIMTGAQGGRNHSGIYYWQDAATPNPDFLAQNVSLTIGENYTFSFWLMADGGSGQVLVNIFQK